MTKKLVRCPFCGSRKVRIEEEYNFICCSSCGAEMWGELCSNEEITNFWNSRLPLEKIIFYYKQRLVDFQDILRNNELNEKDTEEYKGRINEIQNFLRNLYNEIDIENVEDDL